MLNTEVNNLDTLKGIEESSTIGLAENTSAGETNLPTVEEYGLSETASRP